MSLSYVKKPIQINNQKTVYFAAYIAFKLSLQQACTRTNLFSQEPSDAAAPQEQFGEGSGGDRKLP